MQKLTSLHTCERGDCKAQHLLLGFVLMFLFLTVLLPALSQAAAWLAQHQQVVVHLLVAFSIFAGGSYLGSRLSQTSDDFSNWTQLCLLAAAVYLTIMIGLPMLEAFIDERINGLFLLD